MGYIAGKIEYFDLDGGLVKRKYNLDSYNIRNMISRVVREPNPGAGRMMIGGNGREPDYVSKNVYDFNPKSDTLIQLVAHPYSDRELFRSFTRMNFCSSTFNGLCDEYIKEGNILYSNFKEKLEERAQKINNSGLSSGIHSDFKINSIPKGLDKNIIISMFLYGKEPVINIKGYQDIIKVNKEGISKQSPLSIEEMGELYEVVYNTNNQLFEEYKPDFDKMWQAIDQIKIINEAQKKLRPSQSGRMSI